MDEPPSIGQATMLDDGTLELLLRAEAPGVVGDARFVYPPSHPQYRAMLAHIGPMEPGQEKPVPPWPDTDGEGESASE